MLIAPLARFDPSLLRHPTISLPDTHPRPHRIDTSSCIFHTLHDVEEPTGGGKRLSTIHFSFPISRHLYLERCLPNCTILLARAGQSRTKPAIAIVLGGRPENITRRWIPGTLDQLVVDGDCIYAYVSTCLADSHSTLSETLASRSLSSSWALGSIILHMASL